MTDGSAGVDDYIRQFPEDVRAVLEDVRRTIHKALPDAGETISYQIPTITLGGTRVVHFAGWKKHVSLYPVPDGDEAFQQEIAPYRAGKGTVRFPLDQPVPHHTIERLVTLLADRSRS
jgi:uncharacterized protein YdhG (YjbR/CyaY superfamily)